MENKISVLPSPLLISIALEVLNSGVRPRRRNKIYRFEMKKSQ